MPRSPRPQDLMTHVGLRIKVVREFLDADQQNFATAIGLEQNTLSQYETGSRLADPVAMVRMSHKFDIPMDFIYRGSLRGFDFEERQRIEDLAAKHGACLHAPFPEFPMQKDVKTGIAAMRVPGHVPRRRGGGTLHEEPKKPS